MKKILTDGKGVWLEPVEGGVITSNAGNRTSPITGNEEYHDGIDIAVPEGTDAICVMDGIVTRVGKSESYGIYLEYQTDDNYLVFYAHLSETLVNNSERIKKGQIIAKTGNTGYSTGAHLHYKVVKNEVSANEN